MSFAEGLKDLNTVGAFYMPVRLNKRIKETLERATDEMLDITSIMFYDNYDGGFDKEGHSDFMEAITWVRQQIGLEKEMSTIRKTRKIGWIVYSIFIRHFKYSDDKDIDDGMQWIMNKFYKTCSHMDLVKAGL